MGRAKFGLTEKEVGRLTFTTFFKYYKHYKNTFDYEMLLARSGITYSEAFKRSQDAEEWI